MIQNMSMNNFIFDFDKREDYILIINNNNTTTNNEKIFYIKLYLAAAVAIFVSSAVRIG